jgi:translation initiation factor 2B subunit (eIF-2B alpha/beta/delta family)
MRGGRREYLEVSRGFRRLRANRTEGARELGLLALGGLGRWIGRSSGISPELLVSEARGIARSLRDVQPAMAMFRSWSDEWQERLLRRSPGSLRGALEGWIRARTSELRDEPVRISVVVRSRLPVGSRILTISRSSTVLSSLLALPPRRRPREVMALESLPGGEGRTLARELRRGGIPSRVVPDRRAAVEVGTADLVLAGADEIAPDGSVVHKVGTRSLALAARRAGVPFVVLAGGSKRSRRRSRAPLPRLYDRTPARLVSEYWTDRGALRRWT